MDNKEKILLCAEELFYTKGYDATGVQEIAEKAGISKPTLYYYFGSKLGLLQTLLDEKLSVLGDSIAEAVKPDFLERILYKITSTYFEFYRKNKKFYVFLMGLYYSAKGNEAYQSVEKYFEQLYECLVDVFVNANPVLGNMNGRQVQFAVGFLGLISNYIIYMDSEEVNEEEHFSEEVKYSLIHQFMHGIHS